MNTEQLKTELSGLMGFWQQHMLHPESGRIYPGIPIDQQPLAKADMGSMYLSRVLYGAVRAGQIMGTEAYQPLAETALSMLQEFKNPAGGYFWSRKYNMEWVHDPDNVNMGQAFALYGLISYAQARPNKDLDRAIDLQIDFVRSVLADPVRGSGYVDGFDLDWKPLKKQSRAFGTHLHLLEAFVKYYRYRKDLDIVAEIEQLIRLILDRFIDPNGWHCIHRFTLEWERLPDEVWAGHDAECSWILCESAKAIGNEALVQEPEMMALRMMEEVIRCAGDREHGGYFNVLSGCQPKATNKGWWPQAEVVLGLLNGHRITGQEKYLELAAEQVSYIQKYFIDPKGEWFTEVDRAGRADEKVPKVFFWKSLYHTVRYYADLIGYLKAAGQGRQKS